MISYAKNVAFIGALVYRFEFLLPLFQEHMEDLQGEILPHLFVADVERWAEKAVEGTATLNQVEEVLEFLEKALLKDPEKDGELIAVSFLEHLPRPDEPGAKLRDMLGPGLTEELRKIEQGYLLQQVEGYSLRWQ